MELNFERQCNSSVASQKKTVWKRFYKSVTDMVIIALLPYIVYVFGCICGSNATKVSKLDQYDCHVNLV